MKLKNCLSKTIFQRNHYEYYIITTYGEFKKNKNLDVMTLKCCSYYKLSLLFIFSFL